MYQNVNGDVARNSAAVPVFLISFVLQSAEYTEGRCSVMDSKLSIRKEARHGYG